MTTYRTRQEIFDLAYTGLAAQGFELSLLPDKGDGSLTGCAYRGEDNRRCAIGHCIPDDAYNDGLEGLRVFNPDVLAAANISPVDSPFARALQQVHDNQRGRPSYGAAATLKAALIAFAKNYGLTVPEVA